MDKLTTHSILDTDINVWHPKEGESGFAISMSEGGWLTGVFDSVESALMGAKLDLELVSEFYELQKKVNHVNMENRLITVNDLLELQGQ